MKNKILEFNAFGENLVIGSQLFLTELVTHQ